MRLSRNTIGRYRVRQKIPSLKLALLLIVGETMMGTIGYMALTKISFIEALYMTVITISTVGYTEVTQLGTDGRLFSIILIVVNFMIFAYALYVATYYIFEGKIYMRMHEDFITRKVNGLSDHVILCGFGRYGKEASEHFLGLGVPFVVIDKNREVIKDLRENEKEILYIEGDATHDEALIEAGLDRAKAIIVALPDDSDNVFTVLSSKQMNPEIEIISRAQDEKSRKKLKMAGASHVILPDQIGGFYMATLVSKPNAVDFFSFIATEYEKDMGLNEIAFDELPEKWKGKSIYDLAIRENTGANIIGLKTSDNRFVINPSPTTVLADNESFIVLGDLQQLEALKKYFNKS